MAITISNKKDYVYGIQGIADLFGCSRSTANRLKKTGVLNGAISQVGNLIVVDTEKALELTRIKQY